MKQECNKNLNYIFLCLFIGFYRFVGTVLSEYTLDEAIEASKTLVNCEWCVNCHHCKDSKNCLDCVDCRGYENLKNKIDKEG